MKIILRIFAMCTIIIWTAGCNADKKPVVKSAGHEVVSFRALPFPLTDLRLLPGPFLHAQELDLQTLLNYEPDRLLSKFFSEANLRPLGEHYGGWEDESLAGHTLGHYLSACSMMYQSTGDARMEERVNYIVSELKRIQDSTGSGYIGAFPKGRKTFEDEVAKGVIRAKSFDLNGIWSPFYTMHKILAGLRDAYRLCGNKTALEVEKHFTGWIDSVVSPLSAEKVQEMLRCEHGGISETFADLYADTGEEKYLKLAQTFYHKAALDPLKESKDVLPGKHGNTYIPKLISLARIYELTGDTSDRKAAEFFWKTVVNHHSYVTGGNGYKEYFGAEDKFHNRLGPGTTESCNVYNMLKLTGHLFEWNAAADEADFYERALFNHILSSQNPEDGHVTYNLSLAMGGFKEFQDPSWFTCCIGTGMENHSKYGGGIYYHNVDELFLFQYISSELNWKEKGLKVTQKTDYPQNPEASFDFQCEKPIALTLQIRYPSWAKEGMEISVNGRKHKIKNGPGTFIPLRRTWKTGDRVEVRIPFSLRIEPMPDDSNRVAIMYGPLVLAGDLGPMADTAIKDTTYVPVLAVRNRNPESWLKPVAGKPNHFETVSTGKPRDFLMRPFYSIYNRRYSVYWDLKQGNLP